MRQVQSLRKVAAALLCAAVLASVCHGVDSSNPGDKLPGHVLDAMKLDALGMHHTQLYLSADSTVPLNDGHNIPLLGFGTYSITGEEGYATLRTALKLGYRHFDTASMYGNEEEVGRAIRDSGIPREELWVTSKLWIDEQGYEPALEAARASLQRLGLEYMDLYLIHAPSYVKATRLDSWRALIELQRQGLARSIGVSNYEANHLQEILDAFHVVPAVNQIELSPLSPNVNLVVFCEAHGIAVEGYSPLTNGYQLKHPVLRKMAASYSKTVPQLLLRWALQHSFISIPKSSNPAHMAENADVFGFAISDEDMAVLNALGT